MEDLLANSVPLDENPRPTFPTTEAIRTLLGGAAVECCGETIWPARLSPYLYKPHQIRGFYVPPALDCYWVKERGTWLKRDANTTQIRTLIDGLRTWDEKYHWRLCDEPSPSDP